MTETSLPRAHCPRSRALAFMLGVGGAGAGRVKDPLCSETGLRAV